MTHSNRECGRAALGIAWVLLTAGLVPRASSAIEVTVELSFQGSRSDETVFDPPDTMGAVGREHVVELLNGQFAVYRKHDGHRVTRKHLTRFWEDAGVSVERFSFDPRILYDATADRWIGIAADDLHGSNALLLAVSKTQDPAGEWAGFRFETSADSSLSADFPTLGMNRHSVVAAANTFGVESGNREGSVLLVASKASLFASPPSLSDTVFFESIHADALVAFAQPMVDFDLAGAPMILLADVAVEGAIASNELLWQDGRLRLGPIRVLEARRFDPPPPARQPGALRPIDAGKVSRFGSSVTLRNGSLWALSSIDLDGRSALRWLELDSRATTIRQTGLIADPELAFYYGSIAANEYGEVVIGCSGSGPDRFASSYVVVGEPTRGGMHFGAPVLVKEGAGSYERLGKDGRNRWGDYSSTVPDPVRPHVFWTFQQVSSAAGSSENARRRRDEWAVEVTAIRVPEPSAGLLRAAALLGLCICGRRRPSDTLNLRGTGSSRIGKGRDDEPAG